MFKKLSIIPIIILCMIFTAIPLSNKAYAQGSGSSESDAYHITNANTLQSYLNIVQSGSGTYGVIDADFSISSSFHLGSTSSAFTGNLNGNGHTITYSGNTSEAFVPKLASQGNIKNLSLSCQNVSSSGTENIGGFVSYCEGTIKNCHVTVNDVIGKNRAGGFVAHNYGGVIEDCSVTATGTIKAALPGDTSAVNTRAAGGFVGQNYGQIKRCVVDGTATVTTTASWGNVAGGFAGTNGGYYNSELPKGYIESSIVEGSIKVVGEQKDYLGGFTGRSGAYSSGIYDCLVYGHVQVKGDGTAHYVAGFCAYQVKSIQNSFYNADGGISGATEGSAAFIAYRENGAYANNHYNTDKTNLTDTRSNPISNIWWLKPVGKVTIPAEIAAENGLIRAGRHFYFGGKTVQLGYNGSLSAGQRVVYMANGTEINGSVLTMPKEETEVSAKVIQSVNVDAVTLDGNSFDYDGETHNPTALFSGKDFVKGTDYDITYTLDGQNIENCVDAGNYTATVSGKGSFDGTKTFNFSISKVATKIDSNPSVNDLTYNTEDQDLLTAGACTGGTFMYKLEGGEYAEAIPTGKDAGKYNIYYYVKGDNNHNDSEEFGPVEVEIKKAQAKIEKDPEGKDLTYNEESQKLLTEGEAFGGDFVYRFENEEEFSENIPEAINAGDYHVYYKVKGNDNYIESEERGPIDVTINKAQSKVTTKPQKLVLGYKDKDQNLITKGEAYGGAIKYRLKDGKYSDKIPTGKKIGKYYVYYMVEGDENHLDYEERGPITSKINKVGTLMAKISPKGKRGLKLSWKEIKGVDGYDVFFNKCGPKAPKKIKTIKGSKNTTWKKSFLKKNTAYKAKVKAWCYQNKKKVYIDSSPLVHTYTGSGNKKYTIPKGVKVNKESFTLKAGKAAQIKAKIIKRDPKKKLIPESHAKFIRYRSTDKKVATVNEKGKITAVNEGSCTVYAYAVNGISKSIKVAVSK